VMIVNRACSQGLRDSAEAPAVTATINFNPKEPGLDFAYITDIAVGTNAHDWVGHPETAMCAAVDGVIPYITTLRAGEGRLYKIEFSKNLKKKYRLHNPPQK